MTDMKATRQIIKEEMDAKFKGQIEKAVEKGVISALKTVGINAQNGQEIQRDFYFLNTLRKRCEESGSLLFRIMLSSTIAAMAIALWEGVKVLLKR